MCIGPNEIVFYEMKDGAYRASDYVAFLQALMAMFPQVQRGEVCLVMDNARIHHAEQSREFLEENHVRHVFLPPYSPDLNPIENVFGVLKARYRRLGVVQTNEQMKRRMVDVIAVLNLDMDVQPFYDHMRGFVARALNHESFN